MDALALSLLCLSAAHAMEASGRLPSPPLPTLYDPHQLARTWRGEDAGVDADCAAAMEDFLGALLNGTLWATQMWDASGRYSSSFLWGNTFWLGSQTQCLQLEGRGSYSVARLRLNLSSALLHGDSAVVSLGICLPLQCGHPQHAAAILREALPPPPAVSMVRVRTVPDPAFSLWSLPAFYSCLAVLTLLTSLVVAATTFDLCVRSRERRLCHRASHFSACCPSSVVTKADKVTVISEGGGQDGTAASAGLKEASPSPGAAPATATRILLCFSAWTNLEKICEARSQDSLSCLHGLRVFSLLWVVAGHTCMFAYPFSDNRHFRQLVERDFLFQSIGNGAFSVDTFFFISGLLVSYVFLKAVSRRGPVEDAHAGPGFVSCCRQFAAVFSYRILRLTPPYLVVMTLAHVTATWFDRNSVFESPVRDQVNCRDFWWRNVLYINTLFPVSSMCMIWSWYLANDTQFYALGLAVLLLSMRFPKIAAGILGVLVVSSWVTTAAIVVTTEHTPSVDQPLGLFDALYDKPWMRLGPYVVGMSTGWLLTRTGGKLQLPKVAVACGWVLTLALSFTLVHGLYGVRGREAAAAYVSLSHTAWGGVLAWLTVACSTGHGGAVQSLLSHSALRPLSRLTYCAYLGHPLVMLSVFMFMDAPIHLARGTMVVMILGFLVAAYAVALGLSLLCEAPAIALLSLLHPVKRALTP